MSVRSMWALGLSAALLTPAVAMAAPPASFSDLDDYSSNPAYAQFYQQKVAFSVDACSADLKGYGIECAKVKAPLDWNAPAKGTIDVAIGRKEGTSGAGKRLLLSNPGGPGGSGVGYGALSVPRLLGTDNTHYSVGIDPRGIGDSTPLRVALPTPNPADYRFDGDSRTYTREGVQAAIDNTAARNKAISQHPHAPYINSVQTARDFNLVRAILGYQQADYYGISYGTWLGSTMVKMFPNKFDRVILDGNMDWQHPLFDQAARNQVTGSQMEIDRIYLPWLARHHERYGLGTTTAQVNGTIERIRKNLTDPATKTGSADSIESYLRSPAYGPNGFDKFGLVFKTLNDALTKGATPAQMIELNRQIMLKLWGEPQPESDLTDVGDLAVICGDVAGTQDAWEHFRRSEVDIRQRPVFGSLRALPTCNGWTAPTNALTAQIINRPVKQALMVQQEGDPSTPYPFAYSTWRAQRPGTVRLVNVDDLPGHGYAFNFSPCAKAPVSAYLLQGNFPAADVPCQALPLNLPGVDFATSKPMRIVDTQVFEAMYPGTPTSFPRPFLYGMRDLTEPQVDAAASAPSTSTSTRKQASEPVRDDLAEALLQREAVDREVVQRLLTRR